MFAMALFLIVTTCVLLGLLTMPLVPATILAVLDSPPSVNRECSCYRQVVDCSSRKKKILWSSDLCEVRPKVLDVSRNEIETTDNLCYVGRNSLVFCEEEDFFMDELEVLLVHRNMLTQFAAHGIKFASLRKLDISRNRLSDVHLLGLDKLETVVLSFNRLLSLPWNQIPESMPNIKHMDLSHNSISLNGVDEFKYAYQLISINLSNNNVSAFREHGTVDLYELETLDLSSNHLYDINYSFSFLKKLKYLNISHSKISKLSEETFKCIESLKMLDISHNELWYLPNGIFNHAIELEYLDLSNNELSDVRITNYDGTPSQVLLCNASKSHQNRPLHRLNILNLSRNRIEGIKSGTFSEMPNLRSLDLSYNVMSYFMYDVFLAVTNLISLDLSHNELTSLPVGAFGACKNLVQLDVSNNLLTSLSVEAFHGSTNLKELNYSWNFVSALPESVMDTFSQLQNLDISWNVLRILPNAAAQKLGKLHHFNASYNQLRSFPEQLLQNCNCKVQLAGNELPPSRRSRWACPGEDGLSHLARLERAMYWPTTAGLSPLAWVLLLAAAVAGTALLNRRHLLRLPQLPQLPRQPQLPRLPQLPQLPQLPWLPQLPQLPQLPWMPQLPQLPRMPQLPQLPARSTRRPRAFSPGAERHEIARDI